MSRITEGRRFRDVRVNESRARRRGGRWTGARPVNGPRGSLKTGSAMRGVPRGDCRADTPAVVRFVPAEAIRTVAVT